MPVEEDVLAQALQLDALVSVLEQRGVIMMVEVLEEIKRLKEGQPQGR